MRSKKTTTSSRFDFRQLFRYRNFPIDPVSHGHTFRSALGCVSEPRRIACQRGMRSPEPFQLFRQSVLLASPYLPLPSLSLRATRTGPTVQKCGLAVPEALVQVQLPPPHPSLHSPAATLSCPERRTVRRYGPPGSLRRRARCLPQLSGSKRKRLPRSRRRAQPCRTPLLLDPVGWRSVEARRGFLSCWMVIFPCLDELPRICNANACSADSLTHSVSHLQLCPFLAVSVLRSLQSRNPQGKVCSFNHFSRFKGA
jgi:hypothetical protein